GVESSHASVGPNSSVQPPKSTHTGELQAIPSPETAHSTAEPRLQAYPNPAVPERISEPISEAAAFPTVNRQPEAQSASSHSTSDPSQAALGDVPPVSTSTSVTPTADAVQRQAHQEVAHSSVDPATSPLATPKVSSPGHGSSPATPPIQKQDIHPIASSGNNRAANSTEPAQSPNFLAGSAVAPTAQPTAMPAVQRQEEVSPTPTQQLSQPASDQRGAGAIASSSQPVEGGDALTTKSSPTVQRTADTAAQSSSFVSQDPALQRQEVSASPRSQRDGDTGTEPQQTNPITQSTHSQGIQAAPLHQSAGLPSPLESAAESSNELGNLRSSAWPPQSPNAGGLQAKFANQIGRNQSTAQQHPQERVQRLTGDETDASASADPESAPPSPQERQRQQREEQQDQAANSQQRREDDQEQQLDLRGAHYLPPGVRSGVEGPTSPGRTTGNAETQKMFQDSLHNKAKLKAAFESRRGKPASKITPQEMGDFASHIVAPVELQTQTEATEEAEDDSEVDSKSFELLAREVYHLLQQRLAVDRERYGGYYRDRLNL
ncbi:MAG: hypothetical protein AAGH78_14405, partial [Cyanobacteria bacterium P01_H01_bin.58]